MSRYLKKTWNKLTELYGRSILLFMLAMLGIILAICVVVFIFFNSAAPTRLTIASGPEGSVFQRNAEKYKEILARDGVKLTIVSTGGSTDNLHRLLDPKSRIDIGFVQGGFSTDLKTDRLMSLGSISYQPLLVFYRGETRQFISDFAGDVINIGAPGSGTHSLALAILKENGIVPGGDTVVSRRLHAG